MCPKIIIPVSVFGEKMRKFITDPMMYLRSRVYFRCINTNRFVLMNCNPLLIIQLVTKYHLPPPPSVASPQTHYKSERNGNFGRGCFAGEISASRTKKSWDSSTPFSAFQFTCGVTWRRICSHLALINNSSIRAYKTEHSKMKRLRT